MSAQPSASRVNAPQQSLETRIDLPPTDPAQAENATQILDFIAAHEAKHGHVPAPTFYLVGANSGDRVELSSGMHRLLKDVVQAISRGESVSLMSKTKEITTQQAAEILGLSRPTVVDLIDRGELNAIIPGRSRRKLRLVEVLAYRESLHARRDQFIEQSAAAYDFVDDLQDVDLAEVLAEARAAAQH